MSVSQTPIAVLIDVAASDISKPIHTEPRMSARILSKSILEQQDLLPQRSHERYSNVTFGLNSLAERSSRPAMP
jgi:hypothetical protein